MTKREEIERFEKAVRGNDKAAMFEFLINEIVDAGFDGSNLYFYLFDADGQPWPKVPRQMSVPDIIEYIDARLGPVFAGFCRTKSEFTTH
jgi:hypothetical protein